MISTRQRFTRSFEATLFGNILSVGRTEILVLIAATGVTVSALLIMYRPLLFTIFDRDVAEASGVPVGLVEVGFSVVLAVVLIASMQILGVTLIAASVVIPASTARLLTKSFGKLTAASVSVGMVSGVAGMYASYYLNIASGATIVLTATAIFSLAYVSSAVRRFIVRTSLAGSSELTRVTTSQTAIRPGNRVSAVE